MYKSIAVLILVAFWLLLSGCTAGLTTISPPPPAKYEKLGHVEGTATGSLLIASTAYNVIPVALNDRAERAYQDALRKAPGATALMDVTYQEDWFWWIIGSARTVTVSGEAIKEVVE